MKKIKLLVICGIIAAAHENITIMYANHMGIEYMNNSTALILMQGTVLTIALYMLVDKFILKNINSK